MPLVLTCVMSSVCLLLKVFDFNISDEDMAAIAKLGEEKKKRMVNPPFRPNGAPVFED